MPRGARMVTSAKCDRCTVSGGGSAVVGPSWRQLKAGVAEEARTRGFAAPAFAGCAFVEGGTTEVRRGTPVVKPR